jgi:hypothetical protein
VIVPVAGVKAGSRDLSGIKVGDPVSLDPEPTNRFDPNAIAVRWEFDRDGVKVKRHIGYLQRHLAARFAARTLLPLESWSASVIEVLHFDGAPSGIRLALTLRSEVPA